MMILIYFCLSLSFQAHCPPPVAPSNGRVFASNSNNEHGTRLRFACNSGYKDASIVQCDDGKWNSSLPLCEGMKIIQKCSIIPAPKHGSNFHLICPSRAINFKLKLSLKLRFPISPLRSSSFSFPSLHLISDGCCICNTKLKSVSRCFRI